MERRSMRLGINVAPDAGLALPAGKRADVRLARSAMGIVAMTKGKAARAASGTPDHNPPQTAFTKPAMQSTDEIVTVIGSSLRASRDRPGAGFACDH